MARKLAMGGDDRGFFAGMGRSRGDDRARADDLLEPFERGLIDRRRRHVELEIAGHHHPRRAKLCVTFGIGGRLRQTQIEAAEQSRDRRPETAASG